MDRCSFFFIHGAGGTKSKWRLLQKEFEDESIRIIDLPGRGDQMNESASSVQELARYCKEQISEDVILVGHSLGGLVALQTALDNPKVKGLVLVASHYELPVHSKVLDKLNNGIFPDGLFYSSYSKGTSTNLVKEEKEEIKLVSSKQTYSDFKACNEYEMGKESVSRLTIPVLAVYGEEDRMLPQDAPQKLMEVNKQAKVKAVENAARYIMLEQPEALAGILKEFANEIQFIK